MKKNEKTNSSSQTKANNKTKAAKRAKLTSTEQITQLANELGRKVSKQDLLNTFVGLDWGKDNQGRAQNLILNGQIIRSDNRVFYPNGVKPEPTGKHLNAAARVCWSDKAAQMFETMQKAAAVLGVDFAAAGINSIEAAAAALDETAAKQAAAKVEAAAAKREQKLENKLKGYNIEEIEKYLNAKKAAANA